VLTLSARDRERLVVLHQVGDGALSVSEAARRLRLGVRQTRRLLRRFETKGDAAVIHGLRGAANPPGAGRRPARLAD
jgi:transposase